MKKFSFKNYQVVIIVIICIGFVSKLTSSHYETIVETEKEKSKTDINNLTNTYEQQISEYKSQLSVENQNNIITSTTTIKPSGEKIVTKIIDRSKETRQEDKKATSLWLYSDVNKSSFIGENSGEIEKKRQVSSFISKYKLGISGIQPLFPINLTDMNLIAGIRVFNLPIFITSSFPLNLDVSKISFGVEIEF